MYFFVPRKILSRPKEQCDDMNKLLVFNLGMIFLFPMVGMKITSCSSNQKKKNVGTLIHSRDFKKEYYKNGILEVEVQQKSSESNCFDLRIIPKVYSINRYFIRFLPQKNIDKDVILVTSKGDSTSLRPNSWTQLNNTEFRLVVQPPINHDFIRLKYLIEIGDKRNFFLRFPIELFLDSKNVSPITEYPNLNLFLA